MIALILDDRCTRCGLCAQVCPSDVFDLQPDGTPVIARQGDCQTCFMCELYCKADALYVAPNCDHATPVDPVALRASGRLGEFRRDSGWDEWSDDPRYANEHWRMDQIFARARAMTAKAST
jgi:NAD-dependent dihydropyrimidine dehydrogenase PreA subunit